MRRFSRERERHAHDHGRRTVAAASTSATWSSCGHVAVDQERRPRAARRRRAARSMPPAVEAHRDRRAGGARPPQPISSSRGGPNRVQQRAVRVAAGRVEVEETAVADRAEREAGAQDQPRRARAASRIMAQHAHHEASEQQVADRVGEVGRRPRPCCRSAVSRTGPTASAPPSAATARAATRPSSQRLARKARRCCADEQHERDVGGRVEGELSTSLSDGDAAARPRREAQRVVDVAGRPHSRPKPSSSHGVRSARTSAARASVAARRRA